LTYPNGSLLKGNFNKGQLDGQVLFYQKDKDSWTLQDFEGGKLKKVVSEGKGKLLELSKKRVELQY